jgi:hypothetical protein
VTSLYCHVERILINLNDFSKTCRLVNATKEVALQVILSTSVTLAAILVFIGYNCCKISAAVAIPYLQRIATEITAKVSAGALLLIATATSVSCNIATAT